MKFSDVKARNAKQKSTPYKMTDRDGLYLQVLPSGGKSWRYDYRFAGKRKTITFGSFPALTLTDARDKLQAAKRLLIDNLDPSARKKDDKDAANNKAAFADVAAAWLQSAAQGWSEHHRDTIEQRLKNYILPFVGRMPIDEIKPVTVTECLDRISARGHFETAKRTKVIFGQIFRYAIGRGMLANDPTAALRDYVKNPETTKHMAALIEPEELAALLVAVENYSGSFIVQSCMKLQAYTFTRPGEIRQLEWCDVDLDGAMWTIPARKRKLRKKFKADKAFDQLVPLSTQAVEVLRQMQTVTGGGQYVFVGGRSFHRPLSENAVLAALATMGFRGKMTGHGYRAAARTILAERLHWPVDVIEMQLSHVVKDVNGTAYNRATWLEDRKKMMQAWSDFLDDLRDGTACKVIPMRRASE